MAAILKRLVQTNWLEIGYAIQEVLNKIKSAEKLSQNITVKTCKIMQSYGEGAQI